MEESEGRLPEPKGGRRVASIGTWETLDARSSGGEPTEEEEAVGAVAREEWLVSGGGRGMWLAQFPLR